MPAPNSQMFIFLSLEAAESITCPQSFLDHYGLVKTPATETEEAVYYSEAADGLTIREAIQAHENEKLFAWDGSVKPVLTDEDNPATHVLHVLVNPTGSLIMTFAQVFGAYSAANPTKALDPNISIQSRDTWKSFS